MRGLFAGADYVHQHWTDLDRSVDLNAPTPFDRTAIGQTRTVAAANATRPIVPVNGGVRNVNVLMNLGDADYDGLQTQVSYRGSAQVPGGPELHAVEGDQHHRARRQRHRPERREHRAPRRRGARPERGRSAASRRHHRQLQLPVQHHRRHADACSRRRGRSTPRPASTTTRYRPGGADRSQPVRQHRHRHGGCHALLPHQHRPGDGRGDLSQSNNIWHANTGSDDDTSTLTLANRRTLQVVQTVTDADGDKDTASINLGTGVFQIEDDGPNAVVSQCDGMTRWFWTRRVLLAPRRTATARRPVLRR